MIQEKEAWEKVNEEIGAYFCGVGYSGATELFMKNKERLIELFNELLFNKKANRNGQLICPKGSRIYNILLKMNVCTKATQEIRFRSNIRRYIYKGGDRISQPSLSINAKNKSGKIILSFYMPISQEIMEVITR